MLNLHKPPSPRKEILAGRYQLIEEIGRGKFGSVHRALDLEKYGDVAVKIGRPKDPGFAITVLANEGAALRTADHPCIVKFEGEGYCESGPFLAMEYIKGPNMKQFLHGRDLRAKTGLHIMGEVCSALENLHSSGVVHRDLKPKNVMVGTDGSVKLIDFGFSYVKGNYDITRDFSARFGSPIYSPPQDTRGSDDPRADIYSAGVMLYEILMNRINVYLIDALKLIELRLWRGIRQSAEGRVSAKALDIIMCATERDPSKRFQSAKEMRQAIERSLVEPL